MTRRDARELRQGLHGMSIVILLSTILTWLATSCAPDPVYAQTPPDGTAAQVRQLPLIVGVRFAWPTPGVRTQLAHLWRNNREFGACIMHIAVFVKDTEAVREETWVVDSIVPAQSRLADRTTLVDSTCPDSTIGFIHSHPASRVCNLSAGDVIGGGLFAFPLAGIVCGPDGSIGFAFNPLLPPVVPVPPDARPDARLPPPAKSDSGSASARSEPRASAAPDEGSGQ